MCKKTSFITFFPSYLFLEIKQEILSCLTTTKDHATCCGMTQGANSWLIKGSGMKKKQDSSPIAATSLALYLNL